MMRQAVIAKDFEPHSRDARQIRLSGKRISIFLGALAAKENRMIGLFGKGRTIGGDNRRRIENGPDVAAMVDLDVQTTTVRALAQVIRASDEMTRSLIDVLA